MASIKRIEEFVSEGKTYTGNQGIIQSRIDKTFNSIRETSEIILNQIAGIIREKGTDGELVFGEPKPTSLFGGSEYESHWYELYSLRLDGDTVVEVSTNGAEQDLAEAYFNDLVAIYKMVYDM